MPACGRTIAAGRRGGLQPAGRVDRVAGEPEVAARHGQHDHVAGADTAAGLQRDAVAVGEPSAELTQRGERGRRGTHRADRVVLVRDRRAESRHDRVTDELLHHAAVLGDARRDHGVVTVQDLAQWFRVEAFGQLRGTDEVQEQDRHLPARLLGRGGRTQHGTAVRAEAVGLRDAAAARRARHRAALGPAARWTLTVTSAVVAHSAVCKQYRFSGLGDAQRPVCYR
jgi:hypothetical protein